MLTIKKQLLISIVILAVIMAAACQKEDDELTQPLRTNNPMSGNLDKRINEILTPYAQKLSSASVSVGIFKYNETNYYGYGETVKGNNIIPDSMTIYEIGSISKTFTSLLMMQYLQDSELSATCAVNDFLPTDIPLLQHNNKPMQIKHLLNHTSGLPRLPENFATGSDPDNPYQHYDSSMVYDYLTTFVLQRDPGQTMEYSNLATGIAGIILERQTHKSYEQLLLEKICLPLGLNNTKITLSNNDLLNLARGYDDKGNPVSYWDDFNAFKAAGAIRSNAKDLISYGKAIINAETSVLKTQIDSCLKVTFENGNIKQASGWAYQSYNGIEYILHDGGTGGFYSYIVICRSKRTVLVTLFSNTPSEKRFYYISQLIAEVLK